MPRKNEEEPSFDTTWFKGLNDEEIEERKRILLSEHKTLDILRELVYNMGISSGKVVEKDYDSPSWSHKQAHLNGKTEILQRLSRLLTI